MNYTNLFIRIWGYVIIALLLSMIGWVVYYGFKPTPPIIDGKIVTGRVFTCEPRKGHYLNLKYEFKVNGHSFVSVIHRYEDGVTNSDCEKYFVGKSFPVIYESTNPNNCSMLVDSVTFAKFNIPFPDSQKWIYNYITIIAE